MRYTDPISSLTLSLDQQTASGVGAQNGSGNVSGFTMVKTLGLLGIPVQGNEREMGSPPYFALFCTSRDELRIPPPP